MKQPTFRVIAELALMACYVLAGWVLLTQLPINRAVATPIPTRHVTDGAGVTITIQTLEGESLSCATAADRASTDTVVVSASEVTRVFRELDCWEPNGT
jgi:hypothetical protein